MTLDGKSLLKPKWIEGKPYCKICIGFHKERQPLTMLIKKAEYILYGCVRCRRLYRSKVKTMQALDELRKIKNHLVKVGAAKEQVEKCRDTWLLCRDIKRELDDIERRAQAF